MKRSTAWILAGAATIALAGTASAETIKLMTGPQGGSWYPLGGAIKNFVEKDVEGASVQVLPGAGIANVKGLQSEKADIGFANSVSTVDAINGKPPFDEPAVNVCNVATLYPQYFQVVALADAGIETPADFKGKALTTQPRGNTAEAITQHMLEAYGLSYDSLERVNFGSYTDGVEQMKDGNTQGMTLGTTAPAGAIMDLASARKIKIVPIEGEGFAAMRELNPGYKNVTIKAGTYDGQSEDVKTIGYATHVIARCDLDADFVYALTKGLAENVDTLSSIASAMKGLTVEAMGEDVGVPMHEGAARFYKEKGAM
ncbi:TAXI family TRAP transporter solute-binding subunit [Marinimicrococcus flavescens]|uniref:TAXI family TRAP transporter solute-binding subunit n=1 Tax=Marinimicrococcus flavescens TaxID=3031815 RepID=A0AAP3XPV5_9PROT|nr:TAXI family TRAP transporter solute-binding subunit [Marinimicrococcus flavescens]